MRWDEQKVAGGPEELPGMPALKGLVRSVRTPEFAGITFHEVRARSVLNRVPGASPMPFSWTVNPYRGCSHACTYCLGPDTPVLMVDGTSVRLADVRVGDLVVGTEFRGDTRSLVPTPVHAVWSTTKPAWRVRLVDGTTLVASAEHRFLTPRGWVHVRPEGCAGTERPHLRRGDALIGAESLADEAFRRPGSPPVAPAPPDDVPGGRVVVTIEEVPGEHALVDLTTGTGDFVADGVISHNCFARNTHTYLDLDAGDDFDRQVVVKLNAPEVLAREVRSPRWGREHVAMGTNTDPYQRAEGRYALMPGIIRALGGSGTPFSILTKGTLLARDLPELTAAARDVPVGVGVSLALLDPELHRRVEPGTPTPRARLDLVRRIRDAGLPCGVFVAPVLPGLTDTDEALDALLGEIAYAGASGASVLALHLRPGTREWFHTWLAREHPELLERYAALYRRGAYVDAAYRRDLAARVRPLIERHGLTGGGHAMGGRQGSSPEGRDDEGRDDEGRETERSWPAGAVPEVPAPVVHTPPEQLSLL
ncbi:Rv2578c family radical SAM protein [Actinomycetospora sp. NBRC 106375]|uniref:Rv2578c family radical SAM protein n=1 Tax=Actinomycetospora sp. NBRC 106375 TaxID=3032207 RepID=UPI0025537146|nr:Rv2578c family radical SAM protein [Actinomycetospora sp. NBRC 106375]